MKRAIFGIIVVVAVGILAFTLYNRTEAQAPVVTADMKVSSSCGSACGSACGGSSCGQASDAAWTSTSISTGGSECCPGGTAECSPECLQKCKDAGCSAECMEKCEQMCKEGKCPADCQSCKPGDCPPECCKGQKSSSI